MIVLWCIVLWHVRLIEWHKLTLHIWRMKAICQNINLRLFCWEMSTKDFSRCIFDKYSTNSFFFGIHANNVPLKKIPNLFWRIVLWNVSHNYSFVYWLLYLLNKTHSPRNLLEIFESSLRKWPLFLLGHTPWNLLEDLSTIFVARKSRRS